MERVKIVITGPNGSGKTHLRKALEAELEAMGRSYKTFDPLYMYKPEEVDFADASVIIMVKTKNKKPEAV